jgi:hypothetical protein
MKYIISHDTALEYWRLHRLPPFTNRGETRRGTPPLRAPTHADLFWDDSSSFSKPLHVLVSEEKGRRKSQRVQTHHSNASFPWGSFCEYRENALMSSPELCFLQMAAKMSLIELTQLGFELCGTYSLPASADSDYAITGEWSDKGFVNCKALTSVSRLRKFIANTSDIHGRKRAMQAVQFVVDNSASPMETNLAILLTLPYRLGGYGLPLPILNHPIEGSSYCCDLFWQLAKLAVEYDSNQFHTGSERIARDSRRRSALALLGVKVVTITWQQVFSTVKFREAVTLLAKNLGRRLRLKDPDFTNQHLLLKAQLFGRA